MALAVTSTGGTGGTKLGFDTAFGLRDEGRQAVGLLFRLSRAKSPSPSHEPNSLASAQRHSKAAAAAAVAASL